MAGILPLISQSFGKMHPSPFLLCTNRTGEVDLWMLVALYHTEMGFLNFSDSTRVSFGITILPFSGSFLSSLQLLFSIPKSLIFMLLPFKCCCGLLLEFEASFCRLRAEYAQAVAFLTWFACTLQSRGQVLKTHSASRAQQAFSFLLPWLQSYLHSNGSSELATIPTVL